MTRTKPKRLTYMGTPADVFDIRKAGQLGERVAITIWQADNPAQPTFVNGAKSTKPVTTGQVDALHCKGDGRKPSFQVFAKRTFTSVDEAVAFATEVL